MASRCRNSSTVGSGSKSSLISINLSFLAIAYPDHLFAAARRGRRTSSILAAVPPAPRPQNASNSSRSILPLKARHSLPSRSMLNDNSRIVPSCNDCIRNPLILSQVISIATPPPPGAFSVSRSATLHRAYRAASGLHRRFGHSPVLTQCRHNSRIHAIRKATEPPCQIHDAPDVSHQPPTTSVSREMLPAAC